MITYQSKDVENYVKGLEDFQRELVLEMRDAVLSADPTVKEGIKWGSIAFFNKKNICGYRIAKNHVTLLFMEGAKLKNADGILSGDGAKARTYKRAKGEEVNKKAIQDLVRECLDMEF